MNEATLPVSDRFDLDAILSHINTTSTDWTRHHRHRGVRLIHEWLAEHPGATWQQKWMAADGDSDLARHHAAFAQSHADATGRPLQAVHELDGRAFRYGMATLIGLGVLRPGPLLALSRHWILILKDVISQHRTEIERIITMTAVKTRVTQGTALTGKQALGALLAITGKDLADITVEDWITVERVRKDALRPFRQWQKSVKEAQDQGAQPPQRPEGLYTDNSLLSIRWAYAASVRASAVAPHPNPPPGHAPISATLDMATANPRTVEALLDPYADDINGRLYDFFCIVYAECYLAHDFNTVRNLVGCLATYMAAARRALPGVDTLRFPRNLAPELLQELKKRKDTETAYPKERANLHVILQSVRRFYEYAADVVTDEEYAQYADLVGPFPIARNIVSSLGTAYSKRSRSALHANIRAKITTLEDLIPAANLVHEHALQRLEVATATPPGSTFTHDGIEYIRLATVSHPASRYEPVGIRKMPNKTGFMDAGDLAHRATRTRAVVTTFRHTGIRREELCELAVDDLVLADIDGSQVPALDVGPGKDGRTRLIALHQDALGALIDLIESYKMLYGEVPLASRRDGYEAQELEPRRFLFQHQFNGAFITPDESTFTNYLNAVIREYNYIAKLQGADRPTLKRIRPHDFRRMFTTDLLEKDVPIEAVRRLLGHTKLDTTQIYDHTTWERAQVKFLDSHRQAAVQRGTQVVCDRCHGAGYIKVNA